MREVTGQELMGVSSSVILPESFLSGQALQRRKLKSFFEAGFFLILVLSAAADSL